MKKNFKKISRAFKDNFGDTGNVTYIRSPGRINIIGEHTDYNLGYVLPAAIDKAIYMGIRPNNSPSVRLKALDVDQAFEFDLGEEEMEKSGLNWPDYIMGVVEQLKLADFKLSGFDAVFCGTIPIGAGLSSSAALEGAVITGLDEIYQLGIENLAKVQLSQAAENNFVGVQCGIMDQFANIFGNKNQAILLDCKTLKYSYVPVNSKEYHFVLCDTKIRRELATSEYNKRRQQCNIGVNILKEAYPQINSLRDVTRDMLLDVKHKMDSVIYRRCRYVIEENGRVLSSVDYFRKNNVSDIGRKMYESHQGLRDDYEVSCTELDVLVEAAEEFGNVLGARMMGGGFGGCTINLIQEKHRDDFIPFVTEWFKEKTGGNLDVYSVRVDKGTRVYLQ